MENGETPMGTFKGILNTSTYNSTKQMVFGKDYFYVILVVFSSAVHGAPGTELFENFRNL